MAVKIHNPNIIGNVELAASAGVTGQVLTSAGAGVQAVWSTPVINTVLVAGCPTLTGLTPGATYRITGLSQGNLGSFAVTTIAKSATELGEAVTIFPSGEAKSYFGLIDWADCQLTWVHDTRNNDIEGKTNISAFVWFNNSFTNNRIDASSTLVMSLAPNSMTDNTVLHTALTITDNGDTFTVTGNVFINATVTLTSPGTAKTWTIYQNYIQDAALFITATGNVTCSDNDVSNQSTITISATNTTATVNQNRLGSASFLTISNSGTAAITVTQNELYGTSSINLGSSAVNTNPLQITLCRLAEESNFAFSGTYAGVGDGLFKHIDLLNGSIVTAVGQAALKTLEIQDTTIVNNSNLLLTTAGGVTFYVVLENQATMTPAGFSIVQSRYEHITYVAIANESGKHRSGYEYWDANLYGAVKLANVAGTSGQVLTSQGAGVQSAWTNPTAFSTGTFTPTYLGSGTPGVWTYSIQQGYYSIIGDRLFFNLYITATARGTAPTGVGYIAGLPVAANSAANNYGIVSIGYMDQITLAVTDVQLVGHIAPGDTKITWIEENGFAPVVAANLPATSLLAGAGMIVSGSYRI